MLFASTGSAIGAAVTGFPMGPGMMGPGMMGPGMMGPGMMGFGSSGPASAPIPGASEVRVEAFNFGFSPSEVHLPKNADVNLTFSVPAANGVVHDFTVPALGIHELRICKNCGFTVGQAEDSAALGRAALEELSVPLELESDGEASSDDTEHAMTLGIALQLINIVRDVDEDRWLGRVYLPQDELAAFGVVELAPSPEFRELMAFEAARARAYLAEGLRLLESLDRRSALCVGTFAGLYRETLARIEAGGFDVFGKKVRLSTPRKLAVVARGLLR